MTRPAISASLAFLRQGLVGTGCILFLSTSVLARVGGGAVASVEFIAPGNRTLSEVALIERAGHPISDKEVMAAGLKSGDRIVVKDQESVVLVHYLATARIVVVRKNANNQSRYYEITAPDVPGLNGPLFKVFADAFSKMRNQVEGFVQSTQQDNRQYALAATRSVAMPPPDIVCPNPAGKSNEPIRFRVPALNPYVNRLITGDRALFLEWRGGVEPYSISLSDSKRKIIVRLDNVRNTCSITLPAKMLEVGDMYLNFRDGNNARVSVQPIDVVAEAPPAPPGLVTAKLPADARTLYYATWLTTQNDGVWAFEAMQMVRALDCRGPGVLEWLSQYGQPPNCLFNSASGPAAKISLTNTDN